MFVLFSASAVQCSAHLDIEHSVDCIAGQWTGVDTCLMFINVIKVFINCKYSLLNCITIYYVLLNTE